MGKVKMLGYYKDYKPNNKANAPRWEPKNQECKYLSKKSPAICRLEGGRAEGERCGSCKWFRTETEN